MTRREWESRWRGKLATADPKTFYNVYTQQGMFYYIPEVDGDFLYVSRDFQCRMDKRTKIHHKDLVRIIG